MLEGSGPWSLFPEQENIKKAGKTNNSKSVFFNITNNLQSLCYLPLARLTITGAALKLDSTFIR
jgi:hypothetical protein